MKTLIKNGSLVDQNHDRVLKDILIEGGTLFAIDKPGAFKKLEDVSNIVDATNCYITPGLIDLHVHLREPGQEWKETVESGAKSAIQGGFTTICCMPNTQPVNDCVEITQFIRQKGLEANAANVLPIGAISLNIAGKELAALSDLKDAGCIAFSDDGHPVYDELLMRRALEWARHLDVPLTCHEEILSLTKGGTMNESPLSYRLGLKGMPTAAEDIMVARDIELSRITGGHVHVCHISSARAVELVRRAKNDGLNITAEVTMHHLTLTEDSVSSYDTNYKMSPPLRSKLDQQALLDGLLDGTIDVIASDHAPHDLDSKRVEFQRAAFGIIGFPTTLPLVLRMVEEGALTIQNAIKALTCNPGKIFKISKSTLSVGEVADITIIDPKQKWIFSSSDTFSKSKNSPYLGEEFPGRARDVFVAGKQKLTLGEYTN